MKVICVVALSVFLAQFTFTSALAGEPQLSNSDDDFELVNTPLPKLPDLPERPDSPAPKLRKSPAPGSVSSQSDLVSQFFEKNPQARDYDMQAVKRFNDNLYGVGGN